MSGIYIPEDKVPTKCFGCTFRDPEYGGACVLMPFSENFNTYEEQFESCPFKKIRIAVRKYVSQRSADKEGEG